MAPALYAGCDLYPNLGKTRFVRRHRIFCQKRHAGIDCRHHVFGPGGAPLVKMVNDILEVVTRLRAVTNFHPTPKRFQNDCISSSDATSPCRTCCNPLFTAARSASVRVYVTGTPRLDLGCGFGKLFRRENQST